MSEITITQQGSFDEVEKYLARLKSAQLFAVLNRYGAMGVAALASATPKDSGATSASWYYEIVQRPGYYSIRWRNHNINNGVPIAILIEYGHGTRRGGYVPPRSFVMPAIQPVFEQMVADIMKEVTK